jgi:hypothetical protein
LQSLQASLEKCPMRNGPERHQGFLAKELHTLLALTTPPVSIRQVPQPVLPVAVKKAQSAHFFAGSVDTSLKPSERRRERWLSGSVLGS